MPTLLNNTAAIVAALSGSLLTAGAIVVAVHVYPPAQPAPIVQQAAIDNDAIGAAVARHMMAAQEHKAVEATAKADKQWCRLMPESASCR